MKNKLHHGNGTQAACKQHFPTWTSSKHCFFPCLSMDVASLRQQCYLPLLEPPVSSSELLSSPSGSGRSNPRTSQSCSISYRGKVKLEPETELTGMSQMLNGLHGYVRQPAGQKQADQIVCLHVTHSNLKQRFLDIRVDLQTTIKGLKEKLRDRCGTAVKCMQLQLYDFDDNDVGEMFLQDFRPLGYYSPIDGYRIHIIDKDPTSISAGGWLENTSLVEKYTISEDDYNMREDTYRKFREKKLAENPMWSCTKIADDYMSDIAARIKVGDRCEVAPRGKRGEVKFVGRVETLSAGYWVGIQYDEPVGKHDGVVKGKRYFTCPSAHGSMLRSDKLKIGDFPVRDPHEDDFEEI